MYRFRYMSSIVFMLLLLSYSVVPVFAQNNLSMTGKDSFNSGFSFIPNDGQFDSIIEYRCFSNGITIDFCRNSFYYHYLEIPEKKSLSSSLDQNHNPEVIAHSIEINLIGANKNVLITDGEMAEPKYSFYIGNDESKWRHNLNTYKSINYINVYKGIDFKYYSDNNSLKYDIVVNPGVNPSIVRFKPEPLAKLSKLDNGDLIIDTGEFELKETAPICYQEINGKRRLVDCEFCIYNDNSYGFIVTGPYESNRPLIIDPNITPVYSSYIGGTNHDIITDMCQTSNYTRFITGYTFSSNYPHGIPPIGPQGVCDLFISKFNADGSLAYSIIIGGSVTDVATGIASDGGTGIYVTGYTSSSDFPMMNPIDNTLGGSIDAFALKYWEGSGLFFSTYIGGSYNDYAEDIHYYAFESHFTICGWTGSGTFPTTGNAYDRTFNGEIDIFITSISDSSPYTIQGSTFLGGSGDDRAYGLNEQSGELYITGFTASSNFPAVNPLYTYQGNKDVFITKFNPALTSISFSTYIGGSGDDIAEGIFKDWDDGVTLVGSTNSSNFPTVNAYDDTYNGGYDAFVLHLRYGSQLGWSTYLGGSGNEYATDISTAFLRSPTVVGYTNSTNFPVINTNTTHNGGYDIFYTYFYCYNGNYQSVSQSGYLGGTGNDGFFLSPIGYRSIVSVEVDYISMESWYEPPWIAGTTMSDDFYTSPNCYDNNLNDGTITGYVDGFITKLDWCDFYAGDANGDEQVIGGDVTFLVQYLAGNNTPPSNCFCRCPSPDLFYASGDANGDCVITGSDVLYLVNYFRGIGQAPKACFSCSGASHE